MNKTRSGPHTWDDFCFLVKDGEKADRMDGVIDMASPDNTEANELSGRLFSLMNLFAEETDAGKVYVCRVALRLDNRNGPGPDITFIRKARLKLVKRGYIAGPADLVMEIVSPDSVERDSMSKRQQYEHYGVWEYWIVDGMAGKVALLGLAADGKYRGVKPRNGEWHSRALPGFWIRPEWLWQQPRPRKMTILKQLLARLGDSALSMMR